tara:strand:+ start:166 stop:504 length:339 start_codon:yes stop_codon:yes gene_type:complete
MYSDINTASNISPGIWAHPVRTPQTYIDEIKNKIHNVFLDTGTMIDGWENEQPLNFGIQMHGNGHVLLCHNTKNGAVSMHFGQDKLEKFQVIPTFPSGLLLFPGALEQFLHP